MSNADPVQGFVEVKKGTAFCRFLSGVYQTQLYVRSPTISSKLAETSFLWLYIKTACALSPKVSSLQTYEFNLYKPPLMKDGFGNITEMGEILIGEASLKVCARGTSEQSFLRRDDCDG
eukprot:747289-Hanusia_phi.AAC.2